MKILTDKAAENKMEDEYISHLTAIVEFSEDAIISKSLDGTIKSWNLGSEKMLGYTSKEMIGKNISLLFPSDCVDQEKKILERVVNNETVEHYETVILKKKGQKVDVSLTVSPLKDRAGKVIGISTIGRDVTLRKKAELEIIKTVDQLRHLTTHLQTVREEERKRIGREIHDELGQQLTAIKMDTVWINKHIPTETVDIKNKLQNIINLLDRSHESLRKILNELRPAMLDENGILEALQWQGQQFTESTGTPLHFSSNQSSIKLSQEIATCIFRLFQESLTNIMRYAVAGKVLSSLNVVNDSIILRIEDDGNGFDPSITKSEKSFGLLGMKERALSLNGKFKLLSSPGKGTMIEVTLPYNNTSLEETEKVSKMKRKS